MKLYLVRHGEYNMSDPAGPLSEQGEFHIKELAHALNKMSLEAQNIFHSGKLRAVQTAALLASSFTSTVNPKVQHGMCPDDNVREFVNNLPIAAEEDTVLVGHMPFMSRLASYLLVGNENKELIDFQTGTVVCLEMIYQDQWVIEWVLSSACHNPRV